MLTKKPHISDTKLPSRHRVSYYSLFIVEEHTDEDKQNICQRYTVMKQKKSQTPDKLLKRIAQSNDRRSSHVPNEPSSIHSSRTEARAAASSNYKCDGLDLIWIHRIDKSVCCLLYFWRYLTTNLPFQSPIRAQTDTTWPAPLPLSVSIVFEMTAKPPLSTSTSAPRIFFLSFVILVLFPALSPFQLLFITSGLHFLTCCIWPPVFGNVCKAGVHTGGVRRWCVFARRGFGFLLLSRCAVAHYRGSCVHLSQHICCSCGSWSGFLMALDRASGEEGF